MNREEMQNWIKTAKKGETLVYYKGHLVEDVAGPGWSPEAKKIGLLFLGAANENKITLVQKKIREGGSANQPVYEYIAQVV